jgi:hypothetical protein
MRDMLDRLLERVNDAVEWVLTFCAILFLAIIVIAALGKLFS